MVPAIMIALSLLAAQPADASPPDAQAIQLPPGAGPNAVAAAVSDTAPDLDDGDIPPGAPSDDYGFVGWCYGALSEYLAIYPQVIPDLKDIDTMFGTSVKEDQPYSADVAAEHDALKRFGAAMDAAERASPQPITLEGVASIQAGRAIWAAAKLQPHRKLADAWLFWGIPMRCETTAKALKSHAHAPRSAAQAWPSAIEIAGNEPAPTMDEAEATALETPPAPPPPPPAGPPPHAGAVLIDPK